MEVFGPRLMFGRVPDFPRKRERSVNGPKSSEVAAVHETELVEREFGCNHWWWLGGVRQRE